MLSPLACGELSSQNTSPSATDPREDRPRPPDRQPFQTSAEGKLVISEPGSEEGGELSPTPLPDEGGSLYPVSGSAGSGHTLIPHSPIIPFPHCVTHCSEPVSGRHGNRECRGQLSGRKVECPLSCTYMSCRRWERGRGGGSGRRKMRRSQVCDLSSLSGIC